MLALSFSISQSDAQQKSPKNVAIFLYENVELLDFAGPGEVFSASGFNVYTVSVDGKEIRSQGFVTVKPQYSVANAPAPDVIVFPGGGTTASANDSRVIDWVKSRVALGSTAMSVCTGAEILARAGLLEGYNVTTFHHFIDGLQEMLPNSKVLKDTRFVDNGNIITTAGVSAGIDGALHLVSRIKGLDVAKSTAFYMEYDKWRPEDGRVDYKNDMLEKLKQTPVLDKENKVVESSAGLKTVLPFEGEVKNLAVELVNKEDYRSAEAVLQSGIKWYPESAGLYQQLAKTYGKLGKPAPPDQDTFVSMIESGKVDDAVSTFDKSRKEFPGWILFGEDRINMAGYHLMQKKDYANAVKVFKLNVKAYPQSANAFDSLGEGLMMAGDKKEAISNYKKSLEMNPGNQNAKDMLARLQ